MTSTRDTAKARRTLRAPRFTLFRAAALPVVALLAQAAPAAAQTEQRLLQPPPVLGIERGLPAAAPNSPLAPLKDSATGAGPRRQTLSDVPVVRGEASLRLDAVETTTDIWNPVTNRKDRVKLRTYNNQLAAPTIAVRPGETVRMTLHNGLPDDHCEPGKDHNTPACFNWTNLHAHGLWVSPTGNSDNVLVVLKPKMEFQYEYNVPADHPSGTFWYHPHRHGSTAIQVASGMAGALIVQGNRLPDGDKRPGDVDLILKEKTGASFKDVVMLFGQIPYACRNADGTIKTDPATGKWACGEGEVGGVDGYDQLTFGTWEKSGRFTMINGQVLPHYVDVKVGQIQRWRLLHAGSRETIELRIRKVRAGATSFDAVPAKDRAAWVKANCTGPAVGQWEFATDGLTRPQFERKDTNILQPGYRSDVLVAFPEAGDYCLLDEEVDAASSISFQAEAQNVLGIVTASGTGTVEEEPTIRAALLAAADRLPVEKVRKKVADDLKDGLKLSSFVPHKPIEEKEVTGHQQLAFNIDIAQKPAVFQVDGQPYDPSRVDRPLTLGGVDQWELTSNRASHPFHIHINPFQVVKVLNEKGEDITDPAKRYEERLKLAGNDPQYLDMRGLWKDTVFVKEGYKVVVRTRYQRYIGEFVLHCHILDHEDQGMMQNVRISLPDSGAAHGEKTAHLTH
ncbi:multicopper oxidase family protein [Azospirillum sp. sgz302134]